MTSNAVRAFALDAIATACSLTPAELDARSRAGELVLDSLTLVSVASRIEAAFGLELASDDLLRLMQAVDLDGLLRVLDEVAERAPPPHE